MQGTLTKPWGPHSAGTVIGTLSEPPAPGAVRVNRARFKKLQEEGYLEADLGEKEQAFDFARPVERFEPFLEKPPGVVEADWDTPPADPVRGEGDVEYVEIDPDTEEPRKRVGLDPKGGK